MVGERKKKQQQQQHSTAQHSTAQHTNKWILGLKNVRQVRTTSMTGLEVICLSSTTSSISDNICIETMALYALE